MSGGAAIRLEPLTPADLPELSQLFDALGLHMPPSNVDQFARPRRHGAAIEVVTLGLREAGRLVGTIGWLELPLRLPGGASGRGRWLVNFYMLPELRGRGLGMRLEEAARDPGCLNLITGGTAHSIPLFEKAGWRLAGSLESWRWIRPALSPARLAERIGGARRREPRRRVVFRHGAGAGSRVCAVSVEAPPGRTPWALPPAEGGSPDCGVPRGSDYLGFVFFGALRRHFRLYEVTVDDAPAGCFALAPRALRAPILGAEIVEVEALPGREPQVLAAALAAARSCADVVRLRITPSARFARALEISGGRRAAGEGTPVRIRREAGPDPGLLVPSIWHVTPADHDQYRARAGAHAWRDLPLSSAPQRR